MELYCQYPTANLNRLDCSPKRLGMPIYMTNHSHIYLLFIYTCMRINYWEVCFIPQTASDRYMHHTYLLIWYLHTCCRYEILANTMTSSSANWPDIKGQKQHKLAVAKGLRILNAPNNPFKIDTSFFHKLAKFPHQHTEPFETGVAGKDERELKGYKQYLSPFVPNGKDVTKDTVIKFCTKPVVPMSWLKKDSKLSNEGSVCRLAKPHNTILLTLPLSVTP